MNKKKAIAIILLLLQYAICGIYVFHNDQTFFSDLFSKSLVEILVYLLMIIFIIVLSGVLLTVICIGIFSVTYILGRLVAPILGKDFEDKELCYTKALPYISYMSMAIGYLWPLIVFVISILSKFIPFMPDFISLWK